MPPVPGRERLAAARKPDWGSSDRFAALERRPRPLGLPACRLS